MSLVLERLVEITAIWAGFAAGASAPGEVKAQDDRKSAKTNLCLMAKN